MPIDSVLYDVTYDYDVPLMVSRGFASESYLYSAAEAIDQKVFAGEDTWKGGVEAHIYYFGDHDPSGTTIDPAIERSIRRILADEFRWAEVHAGLLTFARVAVTEAQIAGSLGAPLPSRPTKLKDNRHAAGWTEADESVELDAIPAGQLRQLVRETIEQHVDQGQLDHLRKVEEEERQQLAPFAKQIAERQ